MTLVSSALTVIALSLWVFLVATVANLTTSDPAGNGLAEVYAVFTSFGLWALLALILIIAGIRGAMSARSIVCAVVLLPGSCIAAFAAIQILKDASGSRWTIVVPALAPPLLLVYAAWLYLPAARAMASPQLADGFTWGMLLLLAAAPWPKILQDRHEARIATAEANTEWEVRRAQEIEDKREKLRAHFKRLGPDSPLWEWVNVVASDSEMREQAWKGIRKLARRQADAEMMLDRGWSFPILELPNLALEPTAGLCERARSFLRQRAEALHGSEPLPYTVVAPRIEIYLPAMRWLVENHCNCASDLRAVEDAIRACPDSPERQNFLEEMARLRAAV
jgi:hypothetical protein